ncbi:MAG TPA: hypothetical protein PKG77_19480 [Phycisphaerae bacterium]|nr:hypothetical protein [Phycisphaerae bacterium]
MKPLEVPLSQFDLDKFLEAEMSFYARISEDPSPTGLVEVIDEQGHPEIPESDGQPRDLKAELIDEGLTHYLAFTDMPFEEATTRCADGSSVPLAQEDEDGTPGLCETTYGFLVAVDDGVVRIRSATWYMGAPPIPGCVEETLDCGEYNPLMESFVRRFILK